jgi:hypothetical protein
MTKYLLGAATAFALLSAPALACDCNKKDTTAQADKKDDKGCHCKSTGADGKCKCGEKCACDHCKPKKEEPKKT